MKTKNSDLKLVKLENIVDTFNGLSGKTKIDFEDKCNAKYIQFKNIHSSNINENELGNVFVSKNERQNSVLKGDILITGSSENIDEVGTTNICNLELKNLYLNSFSYIMRPKNVNSLYLHYYLKSNVLRKSIILEGQGITRINLSPLRIMQIELSLHDESKQIEIANLFSSIDQLIEDKEVLINNVENEFRYNINNLINKENYKFFDKLSLKNFLTKVTDTFYIDDNESYKQITITNDGIIKFRGIKEGSKIGRKRQFRLSIDNKKEYLMFIRQGIFNGGIGFVEDFELNGAIVTENMPILILNEDFVSKIFFKYYLKSISYEKNIMYDLKPTGSAQSSIHEKDFLNQSDYFPSLKEQEKIGILLSSMDK